MSDDAQDKTQDPTPRKREEARKQGQIAFSPDLTGSAVLLAAVIGLRVMGPGIAAAFIALLRERVGRGIPAELGIAEFNELVHGLMMFFFWQVGPLMLTLVAVGIAACMAQVGFHITPERIEVNFDKVNPASGFSKLISTANLVKGLFALVRVAVLAIVVYVLLRPRAGVFAAVSHGDIATAAELSWELVMRIALYLAGVFFLIGVADYAYQRYRHEQSLRMTTQELKDEMKREEGDPLIKARMRQLGREMARRRMLSEVPKATVVITNPTHYAVALRYDYGKMRAPKVVAKGAGVIAQRIVEAARRNAVVVMERPPLARVLYRFVPVDREIPPALFVAVLEVIGFVYRLQGKTV